MKLAVAGKGGVGKSTIAASLALFMAQENRRVLALDADPDADLASALGISPEEQEKIVPIAEQKALIEERTGAKVKQYGQMFKLNPEVADIAASYAYSYNGVDLLVLGAIESGGSGCACPESVLIKALVTDLVLHKNEALIMDFEAGLEHLGRATARGVDMLLAVVEPGRRSCTSACRIRSMASQIGVHRVAAVGNKITSPEDRTFIQESLSRAESEIPIAGWIPYSTGLLEADRTGSCVLDLAEEGVKEGLKQILTTVLDYTTRAQK